MVNSRITLIRAPNPSPMTLSGTNSYIVDCGKGEAICIDPGPDIPSHVEALLAHCERNALCLKWICLTHGHPDHAPAAALLSERTGAPVAAHERAGIALARALGGGDTVAAGDIALQVIEAPGHSGDHLVFYEPDEGALFTGDVVLGEGYVAVLPPEGDMRAYMHTLERLQRDFSGARRIYGGHGAPIADPAAKLDDYIEHRRVRERQIFAALADGSRTIAQLVETIYADTDRHLWNAAALQLQAHLKKLIGDGRVELTGDSYTLR